MSEQNIVNVMVIPDVPKVLPGEQLYVYVPKASFTFPGIIAYNNTQFRIDGNFLFIREDYVSPGVQQKIDELKQYTDDELQLKQDKEDNNISLAQRPEQKSVVGAINDLGTLTQEAKNAADHAQATADNATILANTGISKADQAQTTANTAVDKANDAKATANEAIMKADGRSNSIGFMTAKDAVTALNGYPRTQLKSGDTIWIVETGTPDLWVTEVAQESVPYNYTTKDKFNQDLVDNKVLQIGYFKTAYQESDGKPVTIAWQNVLVKSTDWVASTEFADFPYEAKIELTDFVDYTTVPQVVFDIADTMSGNYAPICKSGDKCVYIYGKVQDEITLKTVITFAPNVNGASVTGGGYANKGKWVASTSYAVNDLVYTDNGQYVCIEGITSTTSPEQDTQHWQATFVATGKTKNGLKFSGQNTDGSAVQKTFDGSQAVEIAFDENTMTAKEVNGVLEIGAKGTVPEALPQEASALKSGNLPTTGWTATVLPLWEGTVNVQGSYNGVVILPPNSLNFNKLKQYTTKSDWQIWTSKSSTYVAPVLVSVSSSEIMIGDNNKSFKIKSDGSLYGYNGSSSDIVYKGLKCLAISRYTFSISDANITVNSDVLMELTDEGMVTAYALANGNIQVIRDAMPTYPIQYTYKVKQTNATGQFTLLNHYVADVPTSLPQETSAVKNGSLPTSGWEKTGFQTFWEGAAKCDASTYKPIGTSKELADILYSDDSAYPIVDYNYQYDGNYNETNVKFSYKNSNASVGDLTGISFRDGSQVDNPTIFIARDGTMYGRGSNFSSSAYAVTYTRIGTSTISQQLYTISDTSITANSDILMELTDEGGVKSYSMEAGKMTVIRDTVPTQAIPYTYKVKQTNASGQFTLVNHYVGVTSVNGQTGAVTIAVPTKTSQLTNDSGFITAADIPSAGEWVTVTENSATLTEAGTYQVLFGENYGVQSIIYWDGSTGANGIPSTTASVTSSGTAIIAERYLTVEANGVLSTHITMITVKDGSWTQTTPSFSGFKYRKIN